MESNLWCSWCYNQCNMVKLQQNMLSRNLYRCSNCAKETKHCILCKLGMSRVQASDRSENTCAVCDKSIPKWGEKPAALLRHCSWCFTLSQQKLIEKEIYECENCHKRTSKCFLCSSSEQPGMTRGEEKQCFKCSKKIKDWSNPAANIAKLSKMGWCSWCIEPSRHVLEEDGGMLGRNVYSCESCGGTTTTCVMCTAALARVGDNWNEASCEVCDIPKTVLKTAHSTLTKKIIPAIAEKLKNNNSNGNNEIDNSNSNNNQEATNETPQKEDINEVKRNKWLNLNQQKKSALEIEYNVELAKMEVMKNSAEKELATQTGLIRPFLLLVSMHPAVRTQIALLLGWCSITRPSYGDSHKEAWDILKMELKGVIARANTITQNLHPQYKDCTYYEMLQKVIEEIFHTRPPCGDLIYMESFKCSVTPYDKRIQLLEEFFIENVAEAKKKNMTDEERKEYNAKKDKLISPELAETNADVLERLAITNEQAKEFCNSLVEEALDAPKEYIKDMIKSAILPKSLTAGHSIVSTAAGIKSSVTNPIFIMKSIYQGTQILFGPTIVKLYGPLVCIMSQRIFLAANKIEIDQFYGSE